MDDEGEPASAERRKQSLPRRWEVIWSLFAQEISQPFHLQVRQRFCVDLRPIWLQERDGGSTTRGGAPMSQQVLKSMRTRKRGFVDDGKARARRRRTGGSGTNRPDGGKEPRPREVGEGTAKVSMDERPFFLFPSPLLPAHQITNATQIRMRRKRTHSLQRWM